MTTPTGSDALWALADVLGQPPMPICNDSPEAHYLDRWWSLTRTFGCPHAQRLPTTWTVIAPDTRIWCLSCARGHMSADKPDHCLVCGDPITHPHESVLSYMESDDVRFLMRWCPTCNNEMESH
ncbi:hypothetical protein [Isoptericola sediminis]|uniref:Uncharacterized protein n=1 Tax=Isoptericola sediminis TaxID=2733572 RepID=A0A849K537_9MICO|nr:hypothetical protein [Isoptericola sediminis]NNU28458.1 hypothetical protein [Isoptericola sediminis]